MIIKATQLKQLGVNTFQHFIKNTTEQIIQEYRDWKMLETFEAKQLYVTDIVVYGQKCNIRASANLGKFVRYIIKYNESIPLPERIEKGSGELYASEEEHLEAIYLKLANGRKQLTLIEI